MERVGVKAILMTIRLRLNVTNYYSDMYNAIGAFNVYNDAAISIAGRMNSILAVSVFIFARSSNDTAPTITVTARKPDSTNVTLTNVVDSRAETWNPERQLYEHFYCGIFDTDAVKELNRIRVASSKNFLQVGMSAYWMHDVLPVSETDTFVDSSGTDYSFSFTTDKQGTVHIGACTRALNDGEEIPDNVAMTKTYSGHYRRALTSGIIQGGIDYNGIAPLRACGAFYEPVHYGMRFG